MSKKALKFVLVLVLLISGIIIPLTLKTSVKAVENNNYELYWKLMPSIDISNSLSGSGNGYFDYVDGDNYPLIYFKIDAYTTMTNEQYLRARWVWSYPNFTVLFYGLNDDMSSAPRFTLAFYQVNEYSAHYFRFNGITSPNGTIQGHLMDIITDIQENGLRIYNQYGGNIVPLSFASDIWLNRILLYGYDRDVINGAYNEGYADGQQEIQDNPNAYGYYNTAQYNQNYENGYNTGYTIGYNAGYDDGSQTPQTFTYNNILSSVWNTASNFLQIPLLGNIKIIHLITLPLLLGLFLIILKIFRS